MLGALAALARDPMLVTDPHGRIVWVNPAFEARSGHRLADVQGHALGMLLASPQPVPLPASSGEVVASEHRLRLADGSELQVRARRTWVGGARGRDWHSTAQSAGRMVLAHASQVKNVWIPYGV